MEGNLRTEQTESFHLMSRGSSFSQTHGRRSNWGVHLALCTIPNLTVLICPTYPSILFSAAVNYCSFLFVGKQCCWSGVLEDTNTLGTDVWGGTEERLLWSCSFTVGTCEGGRREASSAWQFGVNLKNAWGFSVSTASSQFSCTTSQLQIFQLWLLYPLLQFPEAEFCWILLLVLL